MTDSPGWGPPGGPPPPPPAPAYPPPGHGDPGHLPPGYGYPPPAPPRYGYPAVPGPGAPPQGWGWAPPPPVVRPLGGIGLAATLVLAAVAALDLVAAVLELAVVAPEFTGALGPLEDARTAMDLHFLLLGGHALAIAPAAAVWIVWQHRHSTNAGALGRAGGLGPAWAIAGWFIPLAWFVLPPIELSESARATGRTPALLWVWAAALGLGSVVGVAALGWVPEDQTPRTDVARGSMHTAAVVAAAGYLLLALAAAAAAVLARQLTARQEAARLGRPPG